MPVRSLSSSVFKWPDQESVDKAIRGWAAAEAGRHPELIRAGYFGSYARGDWGVGSDLDLVVIVTHAPEPRERRSLEWNLRELPVPAELLVYTEKEWHNLQQAAGRFARVLSEETVWVFPPQREGT